MSASPAASPMARHRATKPRTRRPARDKSTKKNNDLAPRPTSSQNLGGTPPPRAGRAKKDPGGRRRGAASPMARHRATNPERADPHTTSRPRKRLPRAPPHLLAEPRRHPAPQGSVDLLRPPISGRWGTRVSERPDCRSGGIPTLPQGGEGREGPWRTQTRRSVTEWYETAPRTPNAQTRTRQVDQENDDLAPRPNLLHDTPDRILLSVCACGSRTSSFGPPLMDRFLSVGRPFRRPTGLRTLTPQKDPPALQ